MAEKRRRTTGLAKVEMILPEAMDDYGGRVSKEFRRRYLLVHWEDIVGKAVARKVHAVAIKDETLFLHTYEPVWANQIAMMVSDIVEKASRLMHAKIIKEIRFTKHFDCFDESVLVKDKTPQRNIAKESRAIHLSEDEMARAHILAAKVSDPDLAKQVLSLAIRRAQVDAWHKKEGYTPCEICGALIPKKEKICFSCRSRRRAFLRSKIRAVLREIPWARNQDVKDFVPECTPKLLNEQRSQLVQQMAAHLPATDTESLEARMLVMLARIIPPDKLTEEIMRKTIYELRHDMSHPEGYRYPKRYEVFSLRGKSGWKKGKS